MQELKTVAIEAARAGAAVHCRRDGPNIDVAAKSGPSDLVTRVDRDAETALLQVIRRRRPDDSIVSEEGAAHRGTSEVTWILDPLDGTTNLVHGYPHHAVAVGALVRDVRRLGLVIDSSTGRLYLGVAGEGAWCDDEPIAASRCGHLQAALVGTGFLPDGNVRIQQAEILKSVLPRVRDIRRSGSPALDLCAVAAGRLDGYYEFGLGRWDVAAGAAIAEAAGADVLELDLGPLPPPLLIAGSKPVVRALATLLEEALRDISG
jgi:myo-inositol-1(or 4)-monophosphatase